MTDNLAELVDSLLYEGYALYPYTPAAMKNATPTPFGIAYPPAYAADLPSTFDHIELRCVLEAPSDATLAGEVRFLAAAGHRHEAFARRLALTSMSLGELLAGSGPGRSSLERRFDREPGAGESLRVGLELSVRRLAPGRFELALRVENRTPCAAGMDRAGALAHALISTHPILRVRGGGRFVSPLEHPCPSVNTFPVLAGAADDAVVGAAIVLPDHPQIAPESRGGMFDSTEIEEALLLHVKALSDAEREEIERDDPRVREMVARAAAATPEEVLALHGRMTLSDPAEGERRSRVSESPPVEPPGLADPTQGEPQAEVDGVTFRRGGKIVLRPGADADLHARLLDGRTATIERILIDYDGKTHLGVTIDGDAGQELLRDSGRLLFFFPDEVEVPDA
jgi:hypothetical protein